MNQLQQMSLPKSAAMKSVLLSATAALLAPLLRETEPTYLYGQKAQFESELGDITFEKYDAQSRVNARKLALVRDRQSGGEYAEENEAMGGIQQYA